MFFCCENKVKRRKHCVFSNSYIPLRVGRFDLSKPIVWIRDLSAVRRVYIRRTKNENDVSRFRFYLFVSGDDTVHPLSVTEM